MVCLPHRAAEKSGTCSPAAAADARLAAQYEPQIPGALLLLSWGWWAPNTGLSKP